MPLTAAVFVSVPLLSKLSEPLWLPPESLLPDVLTLLSCGLKSTGFESTAELALKLECFEASLAASCAALPLDNVLSWELGKLLDRTLLSCLPSCTLPHSRDDTVKLDVCVAVDWRKTGLADPGECAACAESLAW